MADRTTLTLTTDGAARNNQNEDQRKAAIGYVVQQGSETLLKNGEYLGAGPGYTNNVAEYRAVKLGAEKIVDSWDPEQVELEIQSDSQLIVNQLIGEWDTNDDKMYREREETIAVLSNFARWDATQVSESEDDVISIADDLAGGAFEQK